MRRWLDRLVPTLGRPPDIHKVDFAPADPRAGVYAREAPSVGDHDQGLEHPARDLLVARDGEVRLVDGPTSGGTPSQGVGAELDRRDVELLLTLRSVVAAEKRLAVRAP